MLQRYPWASPDYVLINGGANDSKYSSAQIYTAVRGMLSNVHARWPAARIILVGPMWVRGDPPEGLVRIDKAIKRAAKAGVAFIDPIEEHWVSNANSKGLVWTDNVHPSQAGHEYLARRLTAGLKELGVVAYEGGGSGDS